ncbi:hypothetical protein [Photobacterium leiognathi]|uniref:hypothetical protein n=1 Tax=Photobacterium leiognathi TaxID=553611 RepID=UPI002980E8F4|nr:hypothetical protein [Photobacterium leiognathi]
MDISNVSLHFTSSDHTPIPLDSEWISSLIPKRTIGAYLLLAQTEVIYVGRSDHCLRTRLLNHNHRDKASHVIWIIASSALRAYHQECYWYQCYQGDVINKIEPASPKDHPIKSPFLDKKTINMSLFPN